MIVSNEVWVPDSCGDFCGFQRESGYNYPVEVHDICEMCPIRCCGTNLIDKKDYDPYMARWYTGVWRVQQEKRREKTERGEEQ